MVKVPLHPLPFPISAASFSRLQTWCHCHAWRGCPVWSQISFCNLVDNNRCSAHRLSRVLDCTDTRLFLLSMQSLWHKLIFERLLKFLTYLVCTFHNRLCISQDQKMFPLSVLELRQAECHAAHSEELGFILLIYPFHSRSFMQTCSSFAMANRQTNKEQVREKQTAVFSAPSV